MVESGGGSELCGPFNDLCVIEVGSFIAAPYAAMLLRQLGADVIKIEQPMTGDPSRSSAQGTDSPWFATYNLGKRSLTLDLRSQDAAPVIKSLVEKADVFIENFRPGVAQRLGIDYERLCEINDTLIYCSISSVGPTGPYAQLAGFDAIGQALSGLMSLISSPDDSAPVGPPLADTVAGVIAAFGIGVALHARCRSGRGQRVETSLLDASLSLVSEALGFYTLTGAVLDRFSRARISQIYVFRCEDGLPLVIHLSSPPKFWQNLAKLTGREDLLTNEKYKERRDRICNYEQLRLELSPIFGKGSRADWLVRLREADIPSAPVNTIDEVLLDPQVRQLQSIEAVSSMKPPLRFDCERLESNGLVPTLGQHTDEILVDLGYSELEIKRLRSANVI